MRHLNRCPILRSINVLILLKTICVSCVIKTEFKNIICMNFILQTVHAKYCLCRIKHLYPRGNAFIFTTAGAGNCVKIWTSFQHCHFHSYLSLRLKLHKQTTAYMGRVLVPHNRTHSLHSIKRMGRAVHGTRNMQSTCTKFWCQPRTEDGSSEATTGVSTAFKAEN
jgi:hypothetical protein